MTEHILEQRACANGCRIADGTPAPATRGAYCARCFHRIEVALSLPGGLVPHLLRHMVTARPVADDRVDSSRSAPLPFNEQAFDDANEVWMSLVYWVKVWAEHLGQPVPKVSEKGWRAGGKLRGLAHGVDPSSAGEDVAHLAGWLRVRLEAILAMPGDDVRAFMDAVVDFQRMAARWPLEDRPRKGKAPCPTQDCGADVVVYPPRKPLDDMMVKCADGHVFEKESYELAVRVFEEQQAQVEQTVRHLSKKHGIGVAL